MSARRFFSSSLVLSLAAICVGCGGPVRTPSPDAGADADLPTPGLVDIPWLAAGAPPLTPSPMRVCPAGFRESRTDTGIQLCDPWPEGGPMDCAGANAQFPGDSGCTPIGTACPAGEWPVGLPPERPIVYVRADAVGGNGTMAAPYASVGRAVMRAPPNAIVAVARGTYTGRVELFAGVTVWGACAAETVLTTADMGESEVVVGAFLGGSVGLRNVSVRGAGAMGIYVDDATTVRLEDVVVDGASGYGLYFTGAGSIVTVENVLVRNVARFPSGNAGVGAQVVDGATATFHRVALEHNPEGQLVVAFDSAATVDYLATRDSVGGGRAPRAGTGIAVQMGGQLTLSACALDGNEGSGVLVARGATLVATDIAIRDTGNVGTARSSSAIEVRVGSTATVTGAIIERARGAAVVLGEDGDLALNDSVIRDTRSSLEADASGIGASIEGTAHLALTRVLVENARRGGIIEREGATFDATDVVVRNIEGAGPRGLGAGMSLFGPRASLTRVIIERSAVVGLGVSGAPAVLDAHDVLVRDTRGDPVNGFYGRGLDVNLGAQVTADRVLLERNREVSVFAFDPATQVALSNVVIRDSLAETCITPCASGGLGYGAAVLSGASLRLTGFVITRSALLGVQVGLAGSFTATRGEISSGPIGLNIQEPAFDIATSLSEVEFRTLERTLDTTILPIPDTGLSAD